MDDSMTALERVFREVFDEKVELSRETTANDVEGWDSLMHINLIIAVEKAFNIRFAVAEIGKLKEDGQNVGSFLDLVESKVKQLQ